MTQTSPVAAILRIELWHGLLLLALGLSLGHTKWLDIKAFLIGGAFMGLNFLLLGFGILWVLTPLAGKAKIGLGVSLLLVKMVVFLGLLTLLFFRFDIDGLSFALGFSTLIVAMVVEAVRHTLRPES